MYYIIVGLPLTAVFAAAQFFLCKKAKSNMVKLLPVFCGAGVFLLAELIRGRNLLADAVYGIFGQAIFAVVVILWLLGGAVAAGALIGFAAYFIFGKRN